MTRVARKRKPRRKPKFSWKFFREEVALGYAITLKAIDDNLRKVLEKQRALWFWDWET